MSRILVFNDELPYALNRTLKLDAKQHNVTMNDRACTIIAARYGLEYRQSNAHFQAPTVSRFRLRVPEDLRDALAIDAVEKRATIRGIALNILAGHYGLQPVETRRRPRSTA